MSEPYFPSQCTRWAGPLPAPALSDLLGSAETAARERLPAAVGRARALQEYEIQQPLCFCSPGGPGRPGAVESASDSETLSPRPSPTLRLTDSDSTCSQSPQASVTSTLSVRARHGPGDSCLEPETEALLDDLEIC